jgi:hypothetical protein
MQPIATYDKTRRVLDAIREHDFHRILALLKLNGLVSPLDLNTVLLRCVDQKFMKFYPADPYHGKAESFSHQLWRDDTIDENLLLSIQGGTVNYPIRRFAWYLFHKLGDE